MPPGASIPALPHSQPLDLVPELEEDLQDPRRGSRSRFVAAPPDPHTVFCQYEQTLAYNDIGEDERCFDKEEVDGYLEHCFLTHKWYILMACFEGGAL